MSFHPKFRKTTNQDGTTQQLVKKDDKEVGITESNNVFDEAEEDNESNFLNERQDLEKRGRMIFSYLKKKMF